MIPTFPVSVKAIIKKDNKFLMIRGRRGKLVEYSFPGGLVEKGETLKEALIREVREETGLLVKLIKIIDAQTYLHPLGSGTIGIYYECEIVGGSKKLGHEIDKEFLSLDYLSIDEAPLWSQTILEKMI